MNIEKHMEDHLISIRLDPKRSEKEKKAAGYKLQWLNESYDENNEFRKHQSPEN